LLNKLTTSISLMLHVGNVLVIRNLPNFGFGFSQFILIAQGARMNSCITTQATDAARFVYAMEI